MRFYEVKYALGFGGALYPHRRKSEGAYQRSVPRERTHWNAPPRRITLTHWNAPPRRITLTHWNAPQASTYKQRNPLIEVGVLGI